MKIKNINDLKRSINHSTILVFAVILGLVLGALYLTHCKFINNRALLNKQEIISTGNTYKSNLSEKLSIIASSTVFLDYLNSGAVTRERIYSQFLSQMSTLRSKSISGMQLIDSTRKTIFDYGNSTPFYISLKLCYLNQTLDPEMGDCRFIWKLYFKKADLLNELLSINNAIEICSNCDLYNINDSDKFGSFPIANSSHFKLPLRIEDEKDYFFYVYFFLMTMALVLFGVWSWYRLSGILNNYIANPIKNLTNCLKTNDSLNPTNNIDEIQYLISEINIWKSKLNKIQSDENSAMIGKIAAQLAHDVRSPLSAIDMLIKNLTNIPENYRVTLQNATQRISDISNNFLSQYRKPQPIHAESFLTNEYMPSILESMVAEKRSQYIDMDIAIKLLIANDAWNTFSFVDSTDFKRVLSNLINNSIEAISESGYVIINLIKLKNYLRIEIIDNGCGIAPDLLPKIVAGGVSFGKQEGSGLGLSHAIKRIEEWHGDIDIKSDINLGTEICINLPISDEVPAWFKLSLLLTNNPIICILDDEPQTHNLWEARLTQIKCYFSSIYHFYTSNEMAQFIDSNVSLEIVYLIDYDLGDSITNGIDFIEKFKLHNNATLVTNRYDDSEIQNRCISLGVKIIPKNLISHIPIYN